MSAAPNSYIPSMTNDGTGGYIIDKSRLPDGYPTQGHTAEFWEKLGRAVGTFGRLEEVLFRAIFALTGTIRPECDEQAIKKAVADWQAGIEKAGKEQLFALIQRFDEAIQAHPESRFSASSRQELIEMLQKARKHRNTVCHASWLPSDADGFAKPFRNNYPDTVPEAVDCDYFDQLQRHVAELECEVRDAVTHMGYQVPGLGGPGRPVI